MYNNKRGEKMKIGAFSKKYNISQDTVRYYIKQKMILPPKNGSQYVFTENCERDIEIILELKKYQFTIIEIKKLLFYMRVSKLEPKLKSLFIQSALKQKQEEVTKEILNLKEVKVLLDDHLEEILSEPLSRHKMGVAMNFIDKMACYKCRGHYTLDASSLINNEIIEGKLTCSCGHLLIEDGIIYNPRDKAIREDVLSFSEYVEHTDTEHFQTIYSVMDWMDHQTDYKSFDDKVLLDFGSGFGIFIRSIYNELPENATIICVDYNKKKLEQLKELLSYQEHKKRIVFICCDFKEMPLKDKAVDVLFDIAGRSNYFLHQYAGEKEFSHTLLTDISHYLSPKLHYYGFHYVFKKLSTNHYIDVSHRYLFKKEQIYKELSQMNLSVLNEKTTSRLPVGGRYENFYSEKDNVYAMGLIAKK